MIIDEADKIIADYRSLLKSWNMAMTGFSQDNPEAIALLLNENESSLAAVAIAFPDKAYSVDILINARKRTWAGYFEQRVARPKPDQT
ncbi:MAG TPA: hypothetical protein VIL30_09105 [Ramlibacter sp.]|jgi:hypothetical protein